MENYSFLAFNDDINVDVYVSGSLGREQSAYAFLIIFQDAQGNVLHRLEHAARASANFAGSLELRAACYALTKIKNYRFKQLKLHATRFVTEGATNWAHVWSAGGWRTSQGKPVEDPDLWKELLSLTEELKPQYVLISKQVKPSIQARIVKALAAGCASPSL